MDIDLVEQEPTLQNFYLYINFGNLAAKSSYGKTILHLAVLKEYTKVIHALIRKGADVEMVDDSGNTPLETAIYFKLENVALFLIENGARIDTVNNIDTTPSNISIDLLKNNDADLEVDADAPSTCASASKSASISKSASTTLSPGEDSLLHHAIYSDMNHLIKELITRGASLTHVGMCDKTPIDVLISRGNQDILSYIMRLRHIYIEKE